jgi:putative hydrolase of the HAD superfamily
LHYHFPGGHQLAQITAIFWDVGGVLLTNAWDREQREKTLARFGLDPIEFDDRHDMLVSSFERGKISQDEYLQHTVFYRPRAFTAQAFKDYMFSLSQPLPDSLQLAQALKNSGKYLMGTINNESRELNRFRIHTYGLDKIFSLFVSSCFVGLRKPEAGIYTLALEITQKTPQECCFVDDRPLNVDAATNAGMRAIRMENAAQLRSELEKLGVVA